jgi:hypothetical protein
VSHDDVIQLLRAVASPSAAAPEASALREAIEHAGRCSDCWKVLADLHQSVTNAPPLEAEAMNALFGCDDVQRQLYLLAALEPARLFAEHPGPARHLAWCDPCREGLIDILVMEDAARRGDVEPFDVAPPTTWWHSAVDAMGERVQELVGTLVVEVRRSVAAFATLPAGVEVAPGLVAATRGANEAPSPSVGQRVTLALSDSGLFATVAIDAHGDGRVHVAVAVSGRLSGPMSAELRAADGSVPTLLAAQLFPQSPEIAFREVPAGDYVLEIRERAASRRYRFRLRVDGRE